MGECRACSRSLFFSLALIFTLHCGHDNLSTLNNLDNTDTETISAFRFRLYWLFNCACFTRRGWLCNFPPKEPRVTNCWMSYFTLVCLWCGRSGKRVDVYKWCFCQKKNRFSELRILLTIFPFVSAWRGWTTIYFSRSKGYLTSRWNPYPNSDSTFQPNRQTTIGDISSNPGPERCSVFGNSVVRNHRALSCDSCELWCHEIHLRPSSTIW